ncbi:FkbM family methyltransferase [Paraburkholderia humisilvae]|uniref:Methyltransferase FkbM domain-containing protein n=1 Tax=Paraburkholderia humisilvae TaxID=627669 RepID=A0A6J5EIL4_9BURK|nr:FkbM family methyltransferase [Paraburkholderia humisilvae]CAB3765072.1 hypothetical protein LMG29542_05038 [Paraburkholderia humisilvae]
MPDQKNVTVVTSKFGSVLTYQDDLVTSQILQYGNHTRPEFAFATALLNHDSKVFDLGAHIGTFTLEVLTKLGGEGHVLCVEGDPRTFDLLRMNINQQPRRAQTLLRNCFVGSGSGLEFVHDPDNTGAHHLRPSQQGTIVAEQLDSLVQSSFEPDYIKIDVEGAEFSALGNSEYVRTRRPHLYVEVADHQLARFGHRKEDLNRMLIDLGYRFFGNVGARNARHDLYKIAEIANLVDYGDFFDILCVQRGTPACDALAEAAAMSR